MKNIHCIFILLGIVTAFAWACRQDSVPTKHADQYAKVALDTLPAIDTSKIESFFLKYPEFKNFNSDVRQLYQQHKKYIWFNESGLTEFAQVLYNQTSQINSEGVHAPIPYKDSFNQIFYNEEGNKATLHSEFLISCLYFFYIKNVFEGIDPEKSKALHWYLPREKVSYASLLDTLLIEPGLIKKERPEFFSQYYHLRKALQKLREIAQKGGWNQIDLSEDVTPLKPGDTSNIIAEVRQRLFVEGYVTSDSKSKVFDNDLLHGVTKYQNRQNRTIDSLITASLISELNIPVSERIKTISVNMERCRWITPNLISAKELIAVNIPSFRLHYIRNGKPVLISKVVVGTKLNKTVVFSGEMSYIVFNPYWNVPTSIVEKEIRPAIRKDRRYIAKHNMEWVQGRLRQRPGVSNPLGLVKFMFPNSNNIYLHDTPSKSLFNKDERAFSHGCIRVEKAQELAVAIMAKERGWTYENVNGEMDGKREKVYTLKEKIPIYIAYFTAWADADGNVSFFNDVYNRDEELAILLHL